MAGTGGIIVPIISTFNSKGFKEAQTAGEKFAMVAKAAAIAAAAYAAKLAVDGVKAAIEDEAAQARLATTLQNVTGATDTQIASVEKQILQMSLATGVADDQLRPAYDRLVRATGDLTQSQDLMRLAMDISAGTGKSLDSVVNALGKAYEGSNTSLSRLGTGLDKTALSTMSFDEITQALGATFEGQAATQADTFEGRIARLNVAFDEAKESVGAALLPALENLLTFITDTAIPGLESFGGWIDKNKESLIIFTGVAAALTLVIKAQAIQTAILSGIVKAQIALQAAWNAVMAANPIGLIVIAIAALAAGFVYAWNNSATFRDVVIETAKVGIRGFGDLTKAIGWMAEGIMRLVTFPLRKLLEGLALLGNQDAQNALDSINGAIEGTAAFFDEVGEKIKASAASLDKYKDYQISFFGDTSEAATDAKDVTGAAYEDIAKSAKASSDAQVTASKNAGEAAKKQAETVKEANDRIEAAWIKSMKAAKDAAKAAVETTWNTIQGFNKALGEIQPDQFASTEEYDAAIQKLQNEQMDYRISQILAGNIKVGAETWAAIAPELAAVGVQPTSFQQTTPPVNITVNGALDPEAVARQINQVMQQSAGRTGNYTSFGLSPLAVG